MGMNIEVRLRNSQARIEARIEKDVDQALAHLDDLVNLFQLRADYEWLRAYILVFLPLGVGKTRYIWFEEQMVLRLAREHGFVDSFTRLVIDDLNSDPWGPTIIPSRAAIITRDDESSRVGAR